MESYLPISFLNDFVFCPRSIYFHQLYGRVSKALYHTTVQTKGLAAHKTVDNQQYSTAKVVLQGMEVYSHTYGIGGKIDTFNCKTGLLSERKKKIKVIYPGYIYQLYAQYHALVDMGFRVKKLKLYSMDDNKSHPVALPEDDPECQQQFEQLIAAIRKFDLNTPFEANPKKCQHCIYAPLCDCAKKEVPVC